MVAPASGAEAGRAVVLPGGVRAASGTGTGRVSAAARAGGSRQGELDRAVRVEARGVEHGDRRVAGADEQVDLGAAQEDPLRRRGRRARA